MKPSDNLQILARTEQPVLKSFAFQNCHLKRYKDQRIFYRKNPGLSITPALEGAEVGTLKPRDTGMDHKTQF